MSGPRKTRIILAVLVTCVLTIAAVSFVGLHWDKSVQYQFVALKKGTIESTITSTGTLCPVTQVQVGTQVSGTINKVLPTIHRERPQPQGAPPDPLMKEMPAMFPAFGGESSSGFGSWKQLWYQNANGDIVMEPILTGITDGTNTEIVLSRSLSEGMKVISGSSESTKRSAAKSSARTPGSPPRGMPAPPL